MSESTSSEDSEFRSCDYEFRSSSGDARVPDYRVQGTQYSIDLPALTNSLSPMARLTRVVISGVAHQVTQRGNRRLPVFFCDDDRAAYLALLGEAARASGTACLAWCPMDNHVHLILVPQGPDGLRTMLGVAHRR